MSFDFLKNNSPSCQNSKKKKKHFLHPQTPFYGKLDDDDD